MLPPRPAAPCHEAPRDSGKKARRLGFWRIFRSRPAHVRGMKIPAQT